MGDGDDPINDPIKKQEVLHKILSYGYSLLFNAATSEDIVGAKKCYKRGRLGAKNVVNTLFYMQKSVSLLCDYVQKNVFI